MRASTSPNNLQVRPDWLAHTREEAIEPELGVIDTHHHLYVRPGIRYLLDEYLSDLNTGHKVKASVFVQARSMLPDHAASDQPHVAETEFANGVGAMSASGAFGTPRVCARIVGFADLTAGSVVRPTLERLVMAGGGTGGRFCGIRQTLCWDADTRLLNAAYPTSETMTDSTAFRTGFAELQNLNLGFEAWAFFHQLPGVARLARAFPKTRIVLNHCGGIVNILGYAERADVFDIWKAGIRDLADCPNVSVKLSGLGMRLGGFDFEKLEHAPTSHQLAQKWKPWIEQLIEFFGPQRCMYGSNFPVDKGSYSFNVGINALKHLCSSMSLVERQDVFWRTACKTYHLPEDIGDG
jgi:L-fuconolactonase